MDVEWQVVEMDDSDDEEVRKAKCVRKPSGGAPPFVELFFQENFQELVCLWGNLFPRSYPGIFLEVFGKKRILVISCRDACYDLYNEGSRSHPTIKDIPV